MGPSNADEGQGTSMSVDVQPHGIDHLAPLVTLKKNWAKGERQAFLTSHLDTYKDACLVSRVSSTQALDKIVNAYFVKFHWSLPHTSLPGVPPPVRFDGDGFEMLSAEEAAHKGQVIGAMKKTIYKWYNHRAKAAPALPRSNEDEKEKWSEVVRLEWEEAKRLIEERDTTPRLLEPADAQKVLDSLPSILGPLIEGVGEAIGMHVTVLIGGPEPKKQGQLNTIRYVGTTCSLRHSTTTYRVCSMHYGVDKQAVPKVWGQADKAGFKVITNAFTSFLETCYSPEEQRARAMAKDSLQDDVLHPTNSPSDTSQVPLLLSASKASESELSAHAGGKRKRSVKGKDGRKSEKQKKQKKIRTFVVSDDDEDDEDDEDKDDEDEDDNDDNDEEGSDKEKAGNDDDKSGSGGELATRHSNRLKTLKLNTITPSEERPTLTDMPMVAARDGCHLIQSAQLDQSVPRSPLAPHGTPPSSPTRTPLGHGPAPPSQPTTPLPVPTLFPQPSIQPSPRLVTPQTPPKLPLPLDSSWPTWFQKAYTGLSSIYLSAELTSAIRIYVDFEKTANFVVGSPNAGFKVDNRPPEVAYWVGRGRK
ncbi:hypothetical protein K443DRAFT_44993, partial [Laccaria amethystina LaAM-08-1]